MLQLLQDCLLGQSDWLELRFHDRRSRSVSVEDGQLEVARSSRHAGVGVRALVNGAWGFASTSILDRVHIEGAMASARAAARAAAQTRIQKVSAPPHHAFVSGVFQSQATDPLSDHSFDEKIAMALKADALLRAKGGAITSASAGYTELIDEKVIVTSDGAAVHLFDQKPEMRVSVVAEAKGEMQTGFEAEGHTGGMGELFIRRSLEEMVEKAVQTATDLLSAGYVEGGHSQVILSPDVVGLLIHEAIGHSVEADFVLAGSAAAGKIGQQVASPLVTLRDSGASEHHPGAGGGVVVDDEGVACQRATIIEDGVLVGYLHNRESAAHFDVAPTGNARAFEYDNEPIIRMRNTYMEPGVTPLDEMIAETEDGYLLAGAKNGQADANAEFMFAVGEVYPIKNGKVGTLCRGSTITGDAFDVLRSVDKVGSDFAWQLGSGYCGKGQPAKVDAGGPHLRCQVTLAGQEQP